MAVMTRAVTDGGQVSAAPAPYGLVVHLGLQKTGSTAFQSLVAHNRRHLSDHLLAFLPSDRGPGAGIGTNALRYSRSQDTADLQAFRASLDAVAHAARASDKPVLVSHENLMGIPVRPGQTATLFPSLEVLMAEIVAAFDGLSPCYVVYLRDEMPWKRSLHNQFVRTEFYSGTEAQFLDAIEPCENWAPLVARLQALVGPEHLRVISPQDEPLDQRYPGRTILEMLGIQEADLSGLMPNDQSYNDSLNANALEFLRQVNDLGLPRKAHRGVRRLVLENAGRFAATDGGDA